MPLGLACYNQDRLVLTSGDTELGVVGGVLIFALPAMASNALPWGPVKAALGSSVSHPLSYHTCFSSGVVHSE